MKVSFDHSSNHITSIPSLEDSFEKDVIKTDNTCRQTEIKGLVVKFMECQIKKSFRKTEMLLNILANNFKFLQILAKRGHKVCIHFMKTRVVNFLLKFIEFQIKNRNFILISILTNKVKC